MGLYDEGWVLSETDENEVVFPVWPAKEYAELCAEKEWVHYKSKSFSLDELVNSLLPSLVDDSVLVGVFSTPETSRVVVTGEQLMNDLEIELDNY